MRNTAMSYMRREGGWVLPYDYTFHVERRDIDSGVRENYAFCMVSTVIGRKIQLATRIQTDAQTIRFSLPDVRLVYDTPPEVQQYLIAFDDGAPIEPFTFRLENPMVMPRRTDQPTPARRLTVKNPSHSKVSPGPATRTRAYGQRLLRVNRRTHDDAQR